MGFVTGDMCHQRSLGDANRLEEMYDNNRVIGIMYCSFLTEDVLLGNVEDILALLENHDESFVLKKDKLYRFRLTEESLHKLVN